MSVFDRQSTSGGSPGYLRRLFLHLHGHHVSCFQSFQGTITIREPLKNGTINNLSIPVGLLTEEIMEEKTMTINKNQNGETLNIAIEGRLDTMTAPQLEAEITASVNGIRELILDISNLEYISSAGLRVLLSAQKIMNKQGKMIVRGATDAVMEIFDVTGFTDLLNIE